MNSVYSYRHYADIYAFNKRNSHYVLADIHPDGNEITDLEHDHYGYILNPFIEWLNKNASDTRSTVLTRAATEPADLMKTFNYQTVAVSFPITVSGELAHVALSDADKLTKSGTIQVVTTAYPIHAFDDQASSGDYYLMHQEVTIPNSSWYKGKWTNKHGGVSVRLCAYFMKYFRISNTLTTPLTGTVALTPSPTTTVGQTSYTSGVSWHVDAATTATPDYTIQGSIAHGDDTQTWLPVGTYKMQLKVGTAVYHTASNFTITRAAVYQLNGGNNSPDFVTGAF
jgi:hypothetical protein